MVKNSKNLNELTTEELGRLFPVEIHDFSDEWVNIFQSEKRLISESFLQPEIVSIDHIGSTAVPGLKAKPIVDILLQISEKMNIDKLKNTFISLGYNINYRPTMPSPHLTFVKGYSTQGFLGQAFHVHIRFKGSWDEIKFRDYLITNKVTAIQYEALKIELAKKHRYNRELYTESKTDFIRKVMAVIAEHDSPNHQKI
ncbi:MAG: GrpB family protein [Candidatus Cloacimonetes bacterium]|nr:GrpB family protein [Candidatus Cloacimonadota bacterium]